MDTINYGFTPFAITAAAVVAAEYAASFIPAGPLVVTGGIRILDVLIISFVTWVFIDTAQIPGILPQRFWKGVFRGTIWAAGFGLIAALAGLVCFMAGVDPFSLIYVALPHSTGQLILYFVVGGIVGPFAEEMFFRGVIYGYCRRFGIWVAVIVSTVLFVAAHRISGAVPVPQLVGGIVFAIAYEKEKNLLAPVMIHVLGNLAIFSSALIYFGH